MNRYLAGDVHYFAVLSGPGTVWLQSTPLPVSAASLARYLPMSHLFAQGKAMNRSPSTRTHALPLLAAAAATGLALAGCGGASTGSASGSAVL